MDVESSLENGLFPFVLCVKDRTIVVHDLTLSTKFTLPIGSIFLEKIVLNSRWEVTQAILQEPIENPIGKQWHLSPCKS
jgi:hypothetical protein